MRGWGWLGEAHAQAVTCFRLSGFLGSDIFTAGKMNVGVSLIFKMIQSDIYIFFFFWFCFEVLEIFLGIEFS